MRSLKKFDFVSLGLWAAMWLVTYLVWNHVPETIPTHWNLAGEVDGESSRSFGLVFVPLLATLVIGLITLLVRAVWLKESASVESGFRWVRRGILALFAVMHIALVMAALGGAFDMGRVVMTAVGIFLAYIGLLLPKLPPNKWIGVRTKATLQDAETWKKANYTGSWAFALAGIIVVMGAFLPPIAQLILLILAVIVASLVTVLSAIRKPIPPASPHA